jgi:acetyl-CoA C-acetyltransferase
MWLTDGIPVVASTRHPAVPSDYRQDRNVGGVDPRTPVVVGAGTATQRLDDPLVAKESLALMVAACEAAAKDAGASDLLRRARLVLVPKGSWSYRNPGRLIASTTGNSAAVTVLADLGVLQTTLFERACAAIAQGNVDVAIVVGAETRWRALRAKMTGVAAPSTDDSAAADPDEVLRPSGPLVSKSEIAAGLRNAVGHYALIENARRAADGQSLADHTDTVAALWASFNEVARGNSDAWNRSPMRAEDIAASGPRNRPVAWPYLKWHNSQWNVDQAACLIFCSTEVANAVGIALDRRVYPQTISWSDHMVPLSERAEIHRSPGFRLAFRALGCDPDGIAHIDLYSCFPIAVRTQALEMGLSRDRPWTVTGGMTFAGGPLNSYVLQSTAKMADVLREDAGSLGLVTAISGLITKQGVSLWSTTPPVGGFRAVDVTSNAAVVEPVPVDAKAAGAARIVTYTVLYDESGPARSVIVASVPSGARAVAAADNASLAAAMTREEWCGQQIHLDGNGHFDAAGW